MTLIDRLSKLDGPDREVDAEIAKGIGGLKANREFGMGGNWWDRWTDDGLTVRLPRYTASIDAAIALAERVLPNWQVNISRFHDGHAEASVGARHVQEPSFGKNAAIALCIAILRGKEASHG